MDPQETSIELPGAINALSLSPDKTSVAVAGREVFNIVSIKNNKFEIVHTLRSNRQKNLTYSSVDVKWHPMEQHKNWLATAATNGAVVTWNITKDGSKQDRVITDHARTVNRICWHPDHAYTLLSGSQDGTMRLWDIRDPNNCKVVFDGKNEPIRDVHFSPFYSNYFAAAFENGNIEIWDIRKNSSYERKLSATHQGPVLCIRWHPEDKNILSSGGRDRFIQIWDLNTQKPTHSIETISSVARVEWRLDHRNHITSCALVDSKIHLWNLKRRYIPIALFGGHTDIVTDMQWLTSTQILSCGKDNALRLQTLTQAYRPYQHIRTVGLTWTPKNELAIVSEPINRNDLGESEIPPFISLPSFLSGSVSGSSSSLTLNSFPSPKPVFVPKTIHIMKNIGFQSSIGFDSLVFTHLALNYQHQKNYPFGELCAMNARVAEEVQQFQIAQTWRLLKLFFENEQLSSPSTSLNRKLSTTKSSSSESLLPLTPRMLAKKNPTILDISFQSEEYSDDGSFIPEQPSYESFDDFLSSDIPLSFSTVPSSSNLLPPIPPPLPKKSKKKTESLKEYALKYQDELKWNPVQQVVETLEFYVNQGDVQSAVIMARVLGDRVFIDKWKLLQWTHSYLDLLKRLQLYIPMNEIIKNNKEPEIRRINIMSTVYTTCPNCNKSIESYPGWWCPRCKKSTNPCSICNQRVKGLYVWCQICGHGGHLEHISEWFNQTEKYCPTGCGHACKITKVISKSKKSSS